MTHCLKVYRRAVGKDYEYIAAMEVDVGIVRKNVMRWRYFGPRGDLSHTTEYVRPWTRPTDTDKSSDELPPGYYATEHEVFAAIITRAKSFVTPAPLRTEWEVVFTTSVEAPERERM